MNTPRLLTCLVALAVASPSLLAQDQGLLAEKEWRVIKSEEAPPGTRIQFARDGKLTVTFLIDGAARKVTGTYTLAGNQLTLKLAHDGRERVETRTIKKLTDSVLVTEDKNRKVEELQHGP